MTARVGATEGKRAAHSPIWCKRSSCFGEADHHNKESTESRDHESGERNGERVTRRDLKSAGELRPSSSVSRGTFRGGYETASPFSARKPGQLGEEAKESPVPGEWGPIRHPCFRSAAYPATGGSGECDQLVSVTPPHPRVGTKDGGHEKAPAPLVRSRGSCRSSTTQTEAEGLEPPKACARRISSAVPYQLDYASTHFQLTNQSGRPDLNRRPLAPEASALPG